MHYKSVSNKWRIIYIKGDQMYNAFAEAQDSQTFKTNTTKSKRKSSQINNNFSALHLNPWNHQPSKSYPQLEASHIFSSSQISPNFSPVYRQFSQKYQQKNTNNKSNDKNKKERVKEAHKDHFFLKKQKKILSTAKEQQINMNKTVSVHNFSGEKVFNPPNIIQRRKSLTIEKKKDSRKTTISNPMFLKFCNKFVSDKQKLLGRKKKSLSDFDQKTIDYESEKMIKIREKMMVFYVENGDKNNVKNIHEIRKRLQQNSQPWRNQTTQNQGGKQEGMCIFQNERPIKVESVEKRMSEHQRSMGQVLKCGLVSNVNSNKQCFKLGQRKNLYIGYRKFFHPLYHVIGKQRKCLPIQQWQLQQQKQQAANGEVEQSITIKE